MSEYFRLIESFVSEYAYFAIFAALVLENTLFVGLLVPGLIILLLGGFLAGQGALSIILVSPIALVATVLGDNLSYLLGRYVVHRVHYLHRFLSHHRIAAELLRTEKFYLLVFFQFPAYSRVVIPALLGFTAYPFQRWLVIDLVASLLFTTTVLFVGYAAGTAARTFGEAQQVTQGLQRVFLFLFFLWIVRLIWLLRRRRGTAPSTS